MNGRKIKMEKLRMPLSRNSVVQLGRVSTVVTSEPILNLFEVFERPILNLLRVEALFFFSTNCQKKIKNRASCRSKFKIGLSKNSIRFKIGSEVNPVETRPSCKTEFRDNGILSFSILICLPFI